MAEIIEIVEVNSTPIIVVDNPNPIELNVAAGLPGPPGPSGPAAPDATTTTKGSVKLAGDLAGTADLPTVPGLATKANTSHTHVNTDISDSTAVGRSVLTAADATAARAAIGAGTSNLAIGTTSTTAKAGDYVPADATTAVKGIVQLANHLGGTSAAPTVRSSSETQTGIVELATAAETTTGTDTTRAVHPAGLKVELDKKANTSHTHGVADLTATGTRDATTILYGDNTWKTAPTGGAAAPAASETVAGIVELATTAEATTGTDTVRAVTPAGLKAVADTKAATSHTHTAANISDSTATGRAVLMAADAAAARTAIGAGTSNLAIGTTNTTAKAGDYVPADATTAVKGIVQLANHLGGTATAPTVRSATEAQTGIVELATAAETTTGTDATRAVHPAGLKVELDKKVTADGILVVKAITQAAYDALVTKVATTLYVITG